MKNLFIRLIRFYQKKISPHKKPCCRFRPTCSVYAIEAVTRHGAFAGGLMALCRILRCNPMFKGGYDPVPERFSLKSNVGRFTPPSVCDECPCREYCDGLSCAPLNEGECK